MLSSEKVNNDQRLIREPLTIGGHSAVLLPDTIQDNPLGNDLLLVEDRHGVTPDCYVSESIAETEAESAPKARLFGFWQTMLESGVLDLSNRLTIYQDVRDEIDGSRTALFLETDGSKIISSGQMVGGRLNYNVAPTIDEAVYLTVSVEELKAPKVSVRLPSQIIRDNAAFKQRIQFYSVLIAVAIVALCAGYSYKQNRAATEKQNRLESLEAVNSQLSSKVQLLEKDHVKSGDSSLATRQELAYMLDLATTADDVTIKQASLSKSAGFTATVTNPLVNPDWASSMQINQDGSYTITLDSGGS